MEDKKYIGTIGLEIHAELKTVTKMFCGCKNDPEEKNPNVNICPICVGHPGTLPVINKQAVKNVLKMGVALGSKIADFTEFDRKNYFYPDIPKGYQISQYKFPLITGGKLNNVEITRIHLEEDTARSSHDTGDFSLVDFNRAGLPLMELVTEPVIHSAKEAADFARELQLLLQYLKVGEANMEKGEMRVEANISVSDNDKFGTKVEVKNLNSFKSVEKAIDYEIKRHIKLIESGEKIVQETRGWDEDKEITFSQRKKEDSHDYRYFPDPDLPKLMLSEIPDFKREELLKELPELPAQRRERYGKEFGLTDLEIGIYVNDPYFGGFFELVISDFKLDKKLVKLASNYICSDLIALVKNDSEIVKNDVSNIAKINHKNFADLISMVGSGKISSRVAKDILKIMFDMGGDPKEIAESGGLLQKSDEGTLKTIAQKIIDNNSKVVLDYKAGKQASLQFLIGQGMKETKGSANPEMIKNIFIELLTK